MAVFRNDFCGIVSMRQQLLAQVLGGNVVAQRRHDQALKYQVKCLDFCLDEPQMSSAAWTLFYTFQTGTYNCRFERK